MIFRFERRIDFPDVIYTDRLTGDCVVRHPHTDLISGEISEWELLEQKGLNVNEEIDINLSVISADPEEVLQLIKIKESRALKERELKNDLYFLDFLKVRVKYFNFENWKPETVKSTHSIRKIK